MDTPEKIFQTFDDKARTMLLEFQNTANLALARLASRPVLMSGQCACATQGYREIHWRDIRVEESDEIHCGLMKSRSLLHGAAKEIDEKLRWLHGSAFSPRCMLAGLAMQAAMRDTGMSSKAAALVAVVYADALLEELAKKGEKK
jgi:hypothetical protein